MSGDSVVNEILFDPADTIRVLIHESSSYGNKHSPLSIIVTAQDLRSASMVLVVNNRTYLQHAVDQQQDLVFLNQQLRYPLDLFVDIVKENVMQDDHGRVTSITYSYRRFNELLTFETIITDASNESFVDLNAFDFILGQFTVKDDKIDREVLQVGAGNHEKGNIVASGFETTGSLMRSALKTGGQYTGHLIRYLGHQYTAAMVDSSSNHDGTGKGTYVIDPKVIEAARRRKAWAEGVNSSARTFTSTLLYPVRWTGQKAAKLGNNYNHSQTHQTRDSLSKSMWETAEGMGNGVTSVFKGVTEALSEVGNAIGDTALHHAKRKYGDEYAETITQSYLDAASEIGLAGYKLTNVVSFGLAGLMVDVVVEGTTLLVSLYEYLVGPILLQSWVTLLQPPLTEKRLFYAVLRPWSLALYDHPRQFAMKPTKIIPTFLLDTMPRLRVRGAVDHPLTSPLVMQSESVGSPIAIPREQGAHEQEVGEEADFIEADSVLFSTAAIHEPPENDRNDHPNTVQSPGNQPPTRSQITRVLESWSGGVNSHIELTTIDCSTYLLYMHPDPDSPALTTWFDELKIAVKRVETLARRRSEAMEIALLKRLAMLPKKRVVHVKVLRFLPLMKKAYIPPQQQVRRTSILRSLSGISSNSNGKNGSRSTSLAFFRQPSAEAADDDQPPSTLEQEDEDEDEDEAMQAFYRQEDRERQAVRQMVIDRQHSTTAATAGATDKDGEGDETYEGYLSEEGDDINDDKGMEQGEEAQMMMSGSIDGGLILPPSCLSSSTGAITTIAPRRNENGPQRKKVSRFGGPRMITITATPLILHPQLHDHDIPLTNEEVAFTSTPLLRLGSQLDVFRLALLNPSDHPALEQNEDLQAMLSQHVKNYEAVDNDKLIAELQFSSLLQGDNDERVVNECSFGKLYSLFDGNHHQGKIELMVKNTSSRMKIVTLLGKGSISFDDILSSTATDTTAAEGEWTEAWIPIMKEGSSTVKQVGSLQIAYRVEELPFAVEATAVV